MPQPNSSTKSQKDRDIELLPLPYKVCLDGEWKKYEQTQEDLFEIMFQNEFESKYLSKPYVDSMKEMKKKTFR